MSEEIYEPDPDERAAHDQLEAEAESFLGDNPDHRAGALIRQLRVAAKRAYKRGRDEAIAEQAEARRLESAWRNAEIPLRLRPLFDGVDPGDAKAIQAKIDELRADGIAWGDMVPPPPAAPGGPDAGGDRGDAAGGSRRRHPGVGRRLEGPDAGHEGQP